MTQKSNAYERFSQQAAQWFDDVNSHEITDFVSFIEKAKAYAVAAEEIPHEKVNQFLANLRADIQTFFAHQRADANQSVYLGLLGESFWHSLAKVTDKTQVEWAELTDDFEHHGDYHSGDYIGFGVLQCQRCLSHLEVTHFSQVADCYSCGGDTFSRLPLKP